MDRVHLSSATGWSSVRVRAARAGDAAAIAGIHTRSWRATYAAILGVDTVNRIDEAARTALWSRRIRDLSPGQVALVAGSDSDVAGFLYGGPSPDGDAVADVAQVLSVHVDPLRTGAGLGGALLHRAGSEFAAAGYREATLWVVSDNAGARRFYERSGWAPDGASRHEPLAVEGESGEAVTVVRYRRPLP